MNSTPNLHDGEAQFWRDKRLQCHVRLQDAKQVWRVDVARCKAHQKLLYVHRQRLKLRLG
jgi:hypothetical protein